MSHWKKTIWTASITTIILVNLVLATFLLVRRQVPISQPVSATSTSMQPNLQTEYVMELQKKTRSGPYLIEHYRKMQLQYDQQGNLVSKKPTDLQTYLRYWRPQT